jgi:hypothetical protein
VPKRKSASKGATRPWLLGTNDTPPPLRVPWQMWSKSSDPHEQGLVQFEFTEEGLGVGWCPDGYFDKDVIPWHELAWMAGKEHPYLKREREYLKEQSQTEGYRLGYERAMEEIMPIIWGAATEAQNTENPFLKKYVEDLERAKKVLWEKLKSMGGKID